MGRRPAPVKPMSRSLYISIEVYEVVEALAKREDRPVANMVKVLLKEALRARKEIP